MYIYTSLAGKEKTPIYKIHFRVNMKMMTELIYDRHLWYHIINMIRFDVIMSQHFAHHNYS